MKKIILWALLLALVLTGCRTTLPESSGRTLTDALGRNVTVPEKIERIVCIGVGALRYTCYMGGQELVVGVEDYELETTLTRPYNYVNRDLFQSLPVIGGNGKPNYEAITALNPQVIILSGVSGVDPQEVENRTGIPTFVIPGSDTTLDDNAYQSLSLLGQLLQKQDRAQALQQYLRAFQEELKGHGPSPSVYVGGVSYKGLHGFEGTEAGYGPLALLGANNLADTTGQKGAFNLDLEQILLWDPEVIFLDYEGMDLIRRHAAQNPEYYQNLTAVQTGKVYAQISFRSYAANLETALADAYYCATVLYPQDFPPENLEAKVREIFTQLLGVDLYDDFKEAGYVFGPITLQG